MIRNKTLFAMICAFIGFAIMPAIAMINKMLIGQHHVFEIALYRNLFALLPLIVYIAITRKTQILKAQKPIALAIRCCIGIAGFLLTLTVSRILPLSTTTTLSFVSPLLVPVIAVVFLKERTGWQRATAICIGMAGVLIAAKPSADAPFHGIMLGLAMGLTYALAQIFMRYLRGENPLTINFYTFALGTLICIPLAISVLTVPSLVNFTLMALIGLMSLIVQYLLTLAFRNAEASIISPFNYTALLWATIFDALIWGAFPTLNIWIGAAIIASATLFISYRETLAKARKVDVASEIKEGA